MADKVTPMIFETEDGKEYTLEFSRKTVEWAEQHGFDMDDLTSQMMTKVPELFYYAFRMHHPNMTKQQTDKILFEEFDGLSPDELTWLGNLYAEPFNALINRDESKNLRKVKIRQ